MSILKVEGLSQQFLDKQLYDDAGFQVNKRRTHGDYWPKWGR